MAPVLKNYCVPYWGPSRAIFGLVAREKDAPRSRKGSGGIKSAAWKVRRQWVVVWLCSGPGSARGVPFTTTTIIITAFFLKRGRGWRRRGREWWGDAPRVLKKIKINNDANSTGSWKMTCGCTGWKPVKEISETMRSCGEPHTTSPPHNRLSSFVALGWFVFGSKRLFFFLLLLPL